MEVKHLGLLWVSGGMGWKGRDGHTLENNTTRISVNYQGACADGFDGDEDIGFIAVYIPGTDISK